MLNILIISLQIIQWPILATDIYLRFRYRVFFDIIWRSMLYTDFGIIDNLPEEVRDKITSEQLPFSIIISMFYDIMVYKKAFDEQVFKILDSLKEEGCDIEDIRIKIINYKNVNDELSSFINGNRDKITIDPTNLPKDMPEEFRTLTNDVIMATNDLKSAMLQQGLSYELLHQCEITNPYTAIFTHNIITGAHLQYLIHYGIEIIPPALDLYKLIKALKYEVTMHNKTESPEIDDTDASLSDGIRTSDTGSTNVQTNKSDSSTLIKSVEEENDLIYITDIQLDQIGMIYLDLDNLSLTQINMQALIEILYNQIDLINLSLISSIIIVASITLHAEYRKSVFKLSKSYLDNLNTIFRKASKYIKRY